MTAIAVLGSDLFGPLAFLVRLFGLAVLAGATAGAGAVGYRWYAREAIPTKLAVLLGLGAVALWLNTLVALSQYLGAVEEPFEATTAAVNVAGFLTAAVAAVAGRRAGDRLALSSSVVAGARAVEGEVSPLVRAVGRVVTVTVPEEIGTIEGYDPVEERVVESLSGKTLLFSRGVTVAELEDRFVARLRENYGIGHADVEFTSEGEIAYLAVGSRAAGLGPALAPGHVAVAVRADPPGDASPGDVVQLWSEDGRRVTTGELRGTAADVATIALAAEDVDIDRERGYRLVTLPAGSRPDREFAAALRGAAETAGVVAVREGSALVGERVGAVDATVVAIRTVEETVHPLPPSSQVLEPGDAVHVVARPETLRRLGAVSEPADGD